jgi:hypothetical protein
VVNIGCGLPSFTRYPATSALMANKSIPMSRQPNPGIMTSRCGKTTVAREQRSIERFRQCDVDGVVRR